MYRRNSQSTSRPQLLSSLMKSCGWAITLVVCILLTACAGPGSGPVTQSKGDAEDIHILTYKTQPLDNVHAMRQSLLLRAQEVCHGAFQRLSEYPDPFGLFNTLPTLTWEVRCLKPE